MSKVFEIIINFIVKINLIIYYGRTTFIWYRYGYDGCQFIRLICSSVFTVSSWSRYWIFNLSNRVNKERKYCSLCYQLDFVTPGNKPSCAISRSSCRDKPKSLYTARLRPVFQHRFRNLFVALFKGNFCNFFCKVNVSENDSLVFIAFNNVRRFSRYFIFNLR